MSQKIVDNVYADCNIRFIIFVNKQVCFIVNDKDNLDDIIEAIVKKEELIIKKQYPSSRIFVSKENGSTKIYQQQLGTIFNGSPECICNITVTPCVTVSYQ